MINFKLSRTRQLDLIILILLMSVSVCRVNAQKTGDATDTTIVPVKILYGTLKSIQGEFVSNALVTLLKKDSSLVKATFSDERGAFSIRYSTRDTLQLIISHISFLPLQQLLIRSDSVAPVPMNVTLQPKSVSLSEVTIKDKKPLFELNGDRILLNLEDNPAYAGRNTFDALGAAPRLTIDPISKSISLDGKTGLVLYVNGKQLYSTPSEIIAYLQTLPAANVVKIEILTSPPAKYDAAGAGVILIQTKNMIKEGLTGELSVTGGAGRYVKSNASLSLGLQTKKLQAALFFAPNYQPTYYSWQRQQTLFNANRADGYSSGSQFNYVDRFGQLLRSSLDWTVSKNTVIGSVLQGSHNNETQNPVASLDYRLSSPNAPLMHIDAQNQLQQKTWNLAANLNFRTNFTSTRLLTGDIDIASYDDKYRSTALFNELENNVPSTELFNINYPNRVTIKTAKIDYQSSFMKKGSFETGVKYSTILMNNQPFVNTLTDGFLDVKAKLANGFHYQENTSSAYSNLSFSVKKVNVSAGLRLEHTSYDGRSTSNEAVSRNYTNLFPSLSLNYRSKSEYGISVSANRRIVRPAFDLLNPAYLYFDPLTLYTGNPLLIPQYTTTVQSTLTTPKRLSLTLLHYETQNRITEVVYRIDSIQATTLNTNINFDWERRWSMTLSYPFTIKTGWQLQAAVTAHNTRYYSNYNDIDVYTGQSTAILRLFNTFKTKYFTANLNFIGRTGAVIGYFRYDPLWNIDAGVQRSVGERGSLKLAATDIFHSAIIKNHGVYLNNRIDFAHRYESQQILLTYTYRLGNLKAKSVEERSFGSQTEQDRLQGNGTRK